MQRKLASPSRIRQILAENDLRPSKRFGQNYLTDFNIVKKSIEAAGINKQDRVIEIGPGLGGLTEGLLEKAATVCAVELDRALHPVLTDLFKDNENLTLIQADALKLDVSSLECEPNKLVANLPYNIAAPLLVTYLHNFSGIKVYVVMIQKEVAGRLLAKPSTPEYGALSIKIQLLADLKLVSNVANNAFIPRPKVDSALVRLDRKEQALSNEDRQLFFKTVNAAFSKKRKTILNSLSSGLALEKQQVSYILENSSIAPVTRPQDLSLETYLKLFSGLKDAQLI